MTSTVKLLASFLRWTSKNKGFHQSHLSLYSAILIIYEENLSQSPFRVTRRELMAHSAIRSYATYHRCIRKLQKDMFIDYTPSYHPRMASTIRLLLRKSIL